MKVLLLTGPPGAGRTLVARQLAQRLGHTGVINVEHLREMIPGPHPEIWENEEGPNQHMLAIDNASAITQNFLRAGYNVIIIDVVTEGTLHRYRQLIDESDMWVVQLLPEETYVESRILSNPEYLSRGEVSWIYDQQAAFSGYDDRLQFSDATEIVDWLYDHWPTVIPR